MDALKRDGRPHSHGRSVAGSRDAAGDRARARGPRPPRVRRPDSRRRAARRGGCAPGQGGLADRREPRVAKQVEAGSRRARATRRPPNMVFAGHEHRGRARRWYVVTETGERTEMGHIADLLASTEDEKTPLQRELQRVGKRKTTSPARQEEIAQRPTYCSPVPPAQRWCVFPGTPRAPRAEGVGWLTQRSKGRAGHSPGPGDMSGSRPPDGLGRRACNQRPQRTRHVGRADASSVDQRRVQACTRLVLLAQAGDAEAHPSPAFRKTGVGFLPRPTPGGVPVKITSPGCSVMKWLT